MLNLWESQTDATVYVNQRFWGDLTSLYLTFSEQGMIRGTAGVRRTEEEPTLRHDMLEFLNGKITIHLEFKDDRAVQCLATAEGIRILNPDVMIEENEHYLLEFTLKSYRVDDAFDYLERYNAASILSSLQSVQYDEETPFYEINRDALLRILEDQGVTDGQAFMTIFGLNRPEQEM